MAPFERDLLIKRTNSGLARAKAKAEGVALGPPASLTGAQQDEVHAVLAAGASVSELARQYDTSRQSVMRVRDAVAEAA